MKYGLSTEQWQTIHEIFAQATEVEQVLLFGSRAMDTYKEASDIDFAVKGGAITSRTIAQLKDAFEDSFLPFFVDVVNYHSINRPEFKQHIDDKGIVIYRREWRECKLGDFAEIQTGPFGSQLHAADYVDIGTPLIMPTNIGSRLEVRTDAISCIKESDAKRLEKYLVKENDIVYSRRGDVEKCAFIKNKQSGWLCGTGCLRVRFISNDLLPKFCAYYLSTDEIKGWVSGNAVGTTMPNLNSSILQKLPITLPPLPEQKAIAAVLSSLDDKIDLLYRQNQTLEVMAETLFRQWFIEEAREDWGDFTVSDFAEHIKINVIPAKAPNDFFHHYSLPAYDTSKNPIIELGSEILSNKYQVIENSILVSKLNPRVSRIWLIDKLINKNSICSTEFQLLKPKNNSLLGYLYFLLRSNNATEELTMAASGTSGSHQRVRPEDILNINTSLPSISLAEKFSNTVSPNLKKVEINKIQIQTLEKLRDNLLPKLMNGEVRVNFQELSA